MFDTILGSVIPARFEGGRFPPSALLVASGAVRARSRWRSIALPRRATCPISRVHLCLCAGHSRQGTGPQRKTIVKYKVAND